MEEEKKDCNTQEALFAIKEKISFPHYLTFNHLMVEDMAAVKKKRTTVVGLIEVVIGVLFLIATLASGQVTSWLYPVLAVALILIGGYGLIFYRFLFPMQLKKAAKKQYDQNPYLQHEVELYFFEDTFQEIAAETDNMVEWTEVERIKYHPDIIAVILQNQRCVIIERDSLDGFEENFLSYLERQAQRFEVTAVHKDKAVG